MQGKRGISAAFVSDRRGKRDCGAQWGPTWARLFQENAVSNHLVLIPGLLCTDALYSPQTAALGARVAIHIADHRAHDTMLALASAILQAAPERFALAGLSMGGYIALEIMRAAPERVERLALLNTSARPDTSEQNENRRRLIALAERKGVGVPAREMFPKLVASARSGDELLKAAFLEMAEVTGVQGFANQQAAIMARADNRPTLVQITCPTLVLVGEEDQLTPPDLAREIAEGVAGSRLAVVPGSGHLSTLEAPEAVTAALKTWLET
jgi:pimeloyl-ACP methyl ester carboxylesterase